MNNQEFFDITYRHMTSPAFKPSIIGRRCLYAGPDGTACGVGCALPRDIAERLDAENEALGCNTGWGAIRNRASTLPHSAAAEAVAVLEDVDRYLVFHVQRVHDDLCASWTTKDRLVSLANTYGLKVPT